MLSPLLYSLFTHDCTARHDSKTIIKFADDTTVVGLITNNDETAYREEVRDLIMWCKFLGVHITNKLTWSKHTKTGVKRAQQNLSMGSQILKSFYSSTIESLLTGCITAWYGNCSASNRKAPQSVVCPAQFSKRYRSAKFRSKRLLNSFYPQAITLLNI